MLADAEAAAVELLELPGFERGPHRPELFAELRAEHGQVRLHAQLRRLDRAELDLLDPQLVAHLGCVLAGEPRAVHDQPSQRLAHLQAGGLPRDVAETHDASRLSDLAQESLVTRPFLGPACEEHRRGTMRNEVPPQMLGEEGHHRRDHANALDEGVPQGAQSDLVAVPEATARAADVPVREVVDEVVEGTDHIDSAEVLVGRGRVCNELRRPGHHPVVERLQLGVRTALQVFEPWLEAVDVAVIDQELDRVPERQQPPLHLLRGREAEADVLRRRLLAVEPAHHVGTHPLERLLGLDQVPPGAVHLAALGVEQLLVGEHLPVRRLPGQRDRHEHQRVEPEPDLLAHLGDPVRREPLFPVALVGQVGVGELARGSGRVAALDPLGVLPAERREGDDAGVEPDVADLRHTLDRLAAGLAADEHAIDPGPVQLLELLDAFDRAVLELGPGADHVQLSARAAVERQRQPVEAAARDVPVVHVSQPVVHPLAVLRRRPLDRRVRVEQRLPDLLDADEPVVGDAPDQRRVAAPAVWVAVLVEAGLDEQRPLTQIACDLVGGVARRRPVQPAVVLVEAAGFIDRRQDGQVFAAAELEVLLAGAGRDVDDPGAFLERDFLPGDGAVLDLGGCGQVVVRPSVAPADELLAAQHLFERLVRVARDRHPFAVFAPAVLRVRIDRRGHVRGQRPRRRRPDDQVLPLALEQREANVQRRVGTLLVDAGLSQLVLGE